MYSKSISSTYSLLFKTANDIKSLAIHAIWRRRKIVFLHRPLLLFLTDTRVVTKYLDIGELAEMLGKSPETIRKNMRTNPRSLPPKMYIPGTRMIRWRKAEVEVWLEEQRALG